jgi:fatty-acyl-CoA synthase
VALTSDELPDTCRILGDAARVGVGAWRHATWAWSTNEGDADLAGLPDIAQVFAHSSTNATPAGEHRDADLVILYTSGSTGQPKGVQLGQSAVVENAAAIAARMDYREGERVFSNFPLFFSGGLCNALAGVIAVGGELVTQPRFEPVSAGTLVRERDCTARILWRDGLRPLVEAGALTADDVRRMSRGLLVDPDLRAELGVTGDLGVNMYGMTETATAFTCGDATDSYEVRCRTNGGHLPGNEVRVVDPDTGRPASPGIEGELQVRGPRLFRGYTDGSHAALITEDGFFRTGDVGYLDETGHVHYLGRTKTMIKVKGLTVQPEEVEAVLLGFPEVRRAVVAGLGEGDESLGVGALVVLDPHSKIAPSAIRERCRALLSSYKVPVVTVAEEADFPLSASLKPDRRTARWLLSNA